MKRSAASRTPRYHLPAFLAATVHTSATTPKNNLKCCGDLLVASNALRLSSKHLCQLFGCPPGLWSSPPVIFPSFIRLRSRPSFLSCHGAREEMRSFTDGRLDALASCILEGLRLRMGCVGGTLSAPEANTSQEDLVVHRSEPSKVLRAKVHPYSNVSITSAFSVRTLRRGAVVLSYNSVPNRNKRAQTRRIRSSILNERSARS